MATKVEKSRATREKLLSAARQVFGARGYSDASQAEIVDAAGVTTGALYHHFGDKKGLFRAVAEAVEQEILDHVLANADISKIDRRAMENGLVLTIEKCAEAGLQRIIFRDAPAILGYREWREIEHKYAFGVMRASLAALAAHGVLKASNVDLAAQLTLANVMELAHAAAMSENTEATLREAREMIGLLLDALLIEGR